MGVTCEILGCTPSELFEKHPNITKSDISFLRAYGVRRYEMLGEMFSGGKSEVKR